MSFTDFVFGGESQIAVVMRKGLSQVGTIFSLDTASASNSELALSFEGAGNELRVYYADED